MEKKENYLRASKDKQLFASLLGKIKPRELCTNMGQVFVSDLTYLPYQGKNIYLATLAGLKTRLGI